MTIFYATAKDECGNDVTLETEATTKGDAWEYFDEHYPDCRIYEVLSHDELYERVNRTFAYANQENDWDYDR